MGKWVPVMFALAFVLKLKHQLDKIFVGIVRMAETRAIYSELDLASVVGRQQEPPRCHSQRFAPPFRER